MGVLTVGAAAQYIEFPKLGIHLNIDPTFTIPIGNGIIIHWYGVIIAFAIMVALVLAMKQSAQFGLKEDDLIDMFLIALPVSIVFARLFFVVFTWDSFKNNLLGIFRIWEGGLAIFGALFGAVLSVFIYARRKKVDMLKWCDFAIVYLPLAQAIGRFGNFTNQELYGTNTELPWGMTGSLIKAYPNPGVNPDLPVHPTFLYEALWNVLAFVFLLWLRKRSKVKGGVLAIYLMQYTFIRFLLEFLRTDVFGTGDIRYNQLVSVLVFAGALAFYVFCSKRSRAVVLEEEVLKQEGDSSVEGYGEGSGHSAYSDVLKELRGEQLIPDDDVPDNQNPEEETELAIEEETQLPLEGETPVPTEEETQFDIEGETDVSEPFNEPQVSDESGNNPAPEAEGAPQDMPDTTERS